MENALCRSKSFVWRARASITRTLRDMLFLSARDGAKELRTRPNNIGRWFDELEHYGFLVMLPGPHLGSDGEGQSARYRLTDRYFHGKPPTREFDKWSGEVFRPRSVPIARLKRPD